MVEDKISSLQNQNSIQKRIWTGKNASQEKGVIKYYLVNIDAENSYYSDNIKSICQ